MRYRLQVILTAFLVCGAVVFSLGDEPDSIRMPHDIHDEAGVDCESCHEGILESTEAGRSHRPDMDVCADCHDVDDEDGCQMCHTNVDNAGLEPRPPLIDVFSHLTHSEQGHECAVCHGDPQHAALTLPGKPECRTCHETLEDYAGCQLCHMNPDDLRPDGHGGSWRSFHALPARSDAASCAGCHTESQCQDCHQGDNLRPRSHALDFAFTHAVAARGHELDCQACHMDPGFCNACHAKQNILPRSHSRVGWLSLGDGGRHAVDALFELDTCIACHDAGTESPTCANCHGGD